MSRKRKYICPRCGNSNWTSKGMGDVYDSAILGIDSIQMYASKKCNDCEYSGVFPEEENDLSEKDLEILKEAGEVEKSFDNKEER